MAILLRRLLAARAGRPAAACSGAGGQRDKVLNVYNWSDYIAPERGRRTSSSEYGIKVNYDVFDSNEVLETKLLTGHTDYDVVVPSASFLERQIQAGVYQKLDKALLPNLKYVDPSMMARDRRLRPGQRLRRDLHVGHLRPRLQRREDRARMPDAPVDSLRMIFDPAVVVEVPGLRRVDARCARPRWSARC